MDGSAKATLSKSEKIRTLGALDHLFFPYDFTKAVLDRIDVFYEMSQASSRANIMLLYGETGCGKSTLAEKYRDKILKHVTIEDDDLPALLVATPANCTIKALASHILVQLGDPLAYKGTVPELTKRVVGLIRDKNITLLILDEFQHLMDKKNDQIAYDVADWLKSIVNEISCPIMLVGLPTTKIIINKNEQLERRVSACAELTSFPYTDPQDIERFHIILALFADRLPFANKEIITHPSLASAIHTASGGAIGRVVRLLRLAGLNTVIQGEEMLSIESFAEAYEELTSKDDKTDRRKKPNPFLPKQQSATQTHAPPNNPFISDNQPRLI